MTEEQIQVTDKTEEHRFEVLVDGDLAGIAEYIDSPGVRTFTHTLISPSYEGRGLASRIAVAALDDARARNLAVVPQCPFFAGYIGTHQEYQDLVRA